THLSATALATIGGIELTNKTIVLGRVYYQNSFLEPIVVAGSIWGHIISGLIKRGIKLYWKYKKQDVRKLTGEVHEKVEKIVTDETNEQGVVIHKQPSEATKKRLRIIRNGVIVSSIGLLATGLLVIGGKLRRENIKIPLRSEYLKVYGHVYPQ
ncbi:16397_t:CDS:2, partial [Racocetra fulgida]